MWFCAQSHYWPTPFFDNCFRFLTLIVLIPVHANFPFSIPYFCLILNFIHKRFSLRSHFSLLDRYVVKINILSTIHVVDSNGYFISWLTQCPVKTCEVGQKELKDVMYPFLFLIKKTGDWKANSRVFWRPTDKLKVMADRASIPVILKLLVTWIAPAWEKKAPTHPIIVSKYRTRQKKAHFNQLFRWI